MGPTKALSASLRRSFDFSGRATRGEFWWSWGVLYAVAILVLLYRGMPGLNETARNWATTLLCVLALPMMSVGTRRLKDAGFWRWWFVLTFLFGVAAQMFYFNKPSRAELQAWQFRTERADIEVWLNGYQLHSIFQTTADVLPWIGRPMAILCLVLALFPSRHTDPDAITPKVTP